MFSTGHQFFTGHQFSQRQQRGFPGNCAWTLTVCTIAVMSYVADMSSDVMGYTEPIKSCVLSDNTQHKSGN